MLLKFSKKDCSKNTKKEYIKQSKILNKMKH